MSKYEVLRLNGCDVSQYMDQIDYPHCEKYDLPAVETRFAKDPIPLKEASPKFNWVEPGDCARLNAQVATGLGFNKKPVENCTAPYLEHKLRPKNMWVRSRL